MSVAEAVAGAIQGTANTGISIFNAYQNYKNNQYQKDLQKKIFEREDTALQRRVADAEAAGFNKWSVLGGSGAGAGAVVNTNAPQIAEGAGGSVVDALNAMYQLAIQKNSAKIAEEDYKQKRSMANIAHNQELESEWSTALNVAEMMNDAGFDISVGVDNDWKPGITSFNDEIYDKLNLLPDGKYSVHRFKDTPQGQEYDLYYNRLRNQDKQLQFETDNQYLNFALRALTSIFGMGANAGSAYRSFRRRR